MRYPTTDITVPSRIESQEKGARRVFPTGRRGDKVMGIGRQHRRLFSTLAILRTFSKLNLTTYLGRLYPNMMKLLIP